MNLPEFEKSGKLAKGIHICSGQEFLNRFCSSSKREKYKKPISDILDFAMHSEATDIFVGGSFITNKEKPNDIDCVIVFKKDRFIPSQTESLKITGLRIDILYASLESRNLIDTYIKLFSKDRNDNEVGIVQIDLYDRNETWEILHEPDDSTFEIIKRAYNARVIDFNEREGILVSIHGLLSRAEWNMNISPVASSQGWIFAPYIYDVNTPDLLINKAKRQMVVDDFRSWIYDLKQKYNQKVSIIAHSFGTYILTAYITGFEEKEFPPVTFNNIIFTGSIIRTDFDWDKYKGRCFGSIYNMIAPNDEWVKYMPEKFFKSIFKLDELFGKSGKEGFTKESSVLTQSTNKIFTHNNTIKKDIIETKWMPYLKANRYALDNESVIYMKKLFAEKKKD